MTVQEKLDAYKARKARIAQREEELQAELTAMHEEHSAKTKDDFGIMTGEILGFEQLVDVIIHVAGAKA